MLKDNSKPVANPLATFREDFDDWAILFDPDLDTGFGLNSVGAFIWKRLDGRNTVQDIMAELSTGCDSLPEGAEYTVRDFIQNLIDRGLAGYELQTGWAKTDRKGSEKKRQETIEWDIPVLTELGTSRIAAYIPGDGIQVSGQSGGGCGCGCEACQTGPDATGDCISGGIPDTGCGCGS